MENLKKFIRRVIKELKKYKYTMLATLAFIAVLLLGFGLFRLIMPSNSIARYGNRLDGIKEVEIDNSQFDTVESTLKKEENVSKVETSLTGKIVKVIITVKEGTEVDKAKELSTKALSGFSKKQVGYYDFQVFIKCEKEQEGYPMIGYKNKSNEGFTF